MRKLFKLYSLRWKLVFIKVRSFFPVFLFLIPIIGVLFYWGRETKAFTPVVLICNEDTSFLGGMLLNGILDEELKSLIVIKETAFEEGKAEVNAGRADAMLHIKENTVSTLHLGEKVSLDLYVKTAETAFIRFLKSYISGFTEIINTSQNAGLAYMNRLHEGGIQWEERLKVFNELQTVYVSKALLRRNIFTRNEEGPFFLKKGFLISVASLLLLFGEFGFLRRSVFLKEENRKRLESVGYQKEKIFASELLFLCTLNLFILGCGFWIL